MGRLRFRGHHSPAISLSMMEKHAAVVLHLLGGSHLKIWRCSSLLIWFGAKLPHAALLLCDLLAGGDRDSLGGRFINTDNSSRFLISKKSGRFEFLLADNSKWSFVAASMWSPRPSCRFEIITVSMEDTDASKLSRRRLNKLSRCWRRLESKKLSIFLPTPFAWLRRGIWRSLFDASFTVGCALFILTMVSSVERKQARSMMLDPSAPSSLQSSWSLMFFSTLCSVAIADVWFFVVLWVFDILRLSNEWGCWVTNVIIGVTIQSSVLSFWGLSFTNCWWYFSYAITSRPV